jgi:chromosome partitioning protein
VIITCAGLKGGLGKTTTAAYCAHALAEFGHRVVLLDADPQGSVTRWATGAGWASGPAVRVEPWQPRRAGDLRAAGWSVVIDTPPFADGIVEHALTDATHVVVPMAPTGADYDRMPEMARLIARKAPIAAAVVLLSRVVAGARSTREYRAALVEDGWNVLRTSVPRTEAIAQSFGAPVVRAAATGYGDAVAELFYLEVPA